MSGSNVETWRVVLADGSVRRVEVRAFEYQGRRQSNCDLPAPQSE